MNMWKHRRQMTYMSLFGGLIFPFIVIYNPELVGVAMPFYAFVSITVGAYMKYATKHDKDFNNG